MGEKKSHCKFISYFQSLRSQQQVTFGKDLKYTHTAYGIYCCSVSQSCLTLYYPMDCSMKGFPVLYISWNLFKLTSIKSMMPSKHLIPCHPLLLLSSIFPTIRVFSNESALHIRLPKYQSFNLSISSSN